MPTLIRLVPVLLLALAVRLANVHTIAALPLATYQETWRDSDMALTVEWADHIRGGDWIGRQPAHPFTLWMAMIAPQATWERWWGGSLVFQQAPLYAYVLALIRGVAGTGFVPVALGHLVLGLASVTLVFLLAARAFSFGAATVAGVVAAVYGPFLLHETVWLRDTLAVTTSLFLLWTLGRAQDGGWARWLVAGIAFAAALLTRETTLLFAPFALGWAWRRLAGKRRAPALAALALGAAFGLAPLVARNVAVGAPALSFSTRAIEGFVYGHAADGSPTDLVIPESAKRILTDADGSLWRAIWLTLRTHDGIGALLAWELRKLASAFAAYEAADNVNWYYYAERSWALRLGPPFAAVLGLGLVGLWLERRRGPDERLLRWFVLSTVMGLMYATVLARYRLVLVAALLPHAGATVVAIADALRTRRRAPAVAAAGAAAAIALVSTRLMADHRRQLEHRLNEPMIVAIELSKRGEVDAAFAELRQGLDRAWRDPASPRVFPGGLSAIRLMMLIAAEAGRPRDVVPDLDALIARYPEDWALQEFAGEHWRDRMNDPERAAPYFEAAERLKPKRPA